MQSIEPRRLNSIALNCSRAICLPIGSVLLVVIYCSLTLPFAQAAITWSGNVDPSDPNIWTSSTKVSIGATSLGSMEVGGGSVVQSKSADIGLFSDGSVTVTGADSLWSIYDILDIGHFGNGTLRLEAGGQASNSHAFLGLQPGSSATVIVTGTGSKWTNTKNLYLGDQGSASLTVSDGGTVAVNGMLYAAFTNLYGNGTISVNGGVLDADFVFDSTHGNQQTFAFGTDGQLKFNTNANNDLGAGFAGTGTIRIAQGVEVATLDGYLGFKSGSSGTATITGAGSKWTNYYGLTIGADGSGTLIVEAGGQVGNSSATLGESSTGTGKATVTGTGSKWTNHALSIGAGGKGTLTIDNGGEVDGSYGFVGAYSGAVGTSTVSGAGSKWSCDTELHVGFEGNGTLELSRGGLVTALTMSCATHTGSVGNFNFNGGTLQAGTIQQGQGTANFNWNDGTIRNYDANTDLLIAQGFVVRLAATGTHALEIDSGRTGRVDGILGDAAGNGTLEKTGLGTLMLNAANTYTGKTTIKVGTLSLGWNGSLASSTIEVQSGAIFDVGSYSDHYSLDAGKTLQGSGVVFGNLTVEGIHAPGNSPGVQTVQGNYSLLGQLKIELMGADAGTGYDQVLLSAFGTATHDVAIEGTLVLDWTGMNSSGDSTQLWILRNDTAGTLSGTFANYANGAPLGNHDGRDWFLWYGADAATGSLSGGNDVVIAAVPEPASLVLLGLGGFGIILGIRLRKARCV